MTAPTGRTHIEQAKQHLREARNQIYEKGAHEAVLQCIWALDEVIRHVDEAPQNLLPPGLR